MVSTGIRRTWRILRVASPASATDWEVKAPGQTWWRITSFAALLTTSAVAGSRRVVFVADNGTVIWLRQPSTGDQSLANEAVFYTGHTAATARSFAGNTIVVELPSAGLLLRPGDRFRPITTGLLAGDQWSAINFMLEEIPSGPIYQGDQLALPPEGNPANLYD